jgi:transcriptional regulator with XRE-family HTH domain
MKFSERLKAAREHAQLTQQQLVDKLGFKPDGKPLMSQANLAKMEINPNAKGSIYSISIAKVCGVNPEWLSVEAGKMLSSYDLSPELMAHMQVMQQLPGYARTEVIRDAIKTVELIAKATEDANKPNGTK